MSKTDEQKQQEEAQRIQDEALRTQEEQARKEREQQAKQPTQPGQRRVGADRMQQETSPPLQAAEPAGPHEQQRRLPGQPAPGQGAAPAAAPPAVPEQVNPAGPGVGITPK